MSKPSLKERIRSPDPARAATPQEARAALKAEVEKAGSPERIAFAIGCTRAYVDMIVGGVRTPRGPYAKKIERLYSIPMGAWYQEHGSNGAS